MLKITFIQSDDVERVRKASLVLAAMETGAKPSPGIDGDYGGVCARTTLVS